MSEHPYLQWPVFRRSVVAAFQRSLTLISRTREAQWRPCRFEAKALEQADNWIAQYRTHWEESFDRLDAYLAQVQSKSKGSHGKGRTRK